MLATRFWLGVVAALSFLGVDYQMGLGEEGVGLCGELVQWPAAMGGVPTVALFPEPQERLIAFPQGPNIKYGIITLGNGQDPTISIAVREAPKPCIWVDANNNEDLTDDGGGLWDLQWRWNSFVWFFTVDVDYSIDGVSTTAPYVIKITAHKTTGEWSVFYGSYCLRKGLVELNGQLYTIWLGDMDSDGIYNDFEDLYLAIDVNGDGMPAFSPACLEIFSPAMGPIQIGKKLYTVEYVSVDGRSIRLQQTGETQSVPPLLSPGHPAPEFTSTTIAGETISTQDLRGKVIILNFFPVEACLECPTCVKNPVICRRAAQLGLVRALNNEVAVIGIVTDAMQPAIDQVLRLGVDYPVIWDPRLVSLHRVSQTWLFVVDPEGTIRATDHIIPRFDGERLVELEYDPLLLPEIVHIAEQCSE